jgi:GAF domain-containing protein
MLRSPDEAGGHLPPTALSIAERIRAASDHREPAEVVAALLAIAVDLGICDAVGVIGAPSRQALAPVLATDALAADADGLQCRLEAGPAVEALASGRPVVSDDLAADDRWAGATLDAVGALLAMPLNPDRRLGVLTLYRRVPRTFSADDLALAGTLAAHVCVTLRHQSAVDSLVQAIASRTVIGQAQGILMERYRMTADEAFAALTRCSQDRNVKLVVLAQELSTTGRLTGLPSHLERRAPRTGPSA